jgi:hypothetical protein
MWYVIQARFHGDDEDELFVQEADTLRSAIDAVETDQREARQLPLCDECKRQPAPNDAAAGCWTGDCTPFYINGALECDTEPRTTSPYAQLLTTLIDTVKEKQP